MANTQQTTVLELPHNLTSEEKLEQQNKIMHLLDTKQDLAAELVSINFRHKRDKTDNEKKVGEVEAEINKVRGEIKVGVEMRKYRCNVFRDRDSRKVEYSVIDGPRAGEVVKTAEFTQDDWNAILEDSEPELPFPDVDDEQPDLRAQADLTAEGEVQPDMENGKVIGGPNTDAYNMLHKDSPYQHLSEPADFQSAALSTDAAEPTDAADVDKSDVDPADYRHYDATDTPDESDEDEPTEDDEPQPDPTPDPNPPKRKANRRKDADK